MYLRKALKLVFLLVILNEVLADNTADEERSQRLFQITNSRLPYLPLLYSGFQSCSNPSAILPNTLNSGINSGLPNLPNNPTFNAISSVIPGSSGLPSIDTLSSNLSQFPLNSGNIPSSILNLGTLDSIAPVTGSPFNFPITLPLRPSFAGLPSFNNFPSLSIPNAGGINPFGTFFLPRQDPIGIIPFVPRLEERLGTSLDSTPLANHPTTE